MPNSIGTTTPNSKYFGKGKANKFQLPRKKEAVLAKTIFQQQGMSIPICLSKEQTSK